MKYLLPIFIVGIAILVLGIFNHDNVKIVSHKDKQNQTSNNDTEENSSNLKSVKTKEQKEEKQLQEILDLYEKLENQKPIDKERIDYWKGDTSKANDPLVDLKDLINLDMKRVNSLKYSWFDIYATFDKRAHPFLTKFFKTVRNHEGYKTIKEGKFILVEEKLSQEERRDEKRLIFFGNEQLVFRSLSIIDPGQIYILIEKPDSYYCLDYQPGAYRWKEELDGLFYFPLVNLEEYEEKMGVYTIPYFGEKSKAIVLALDEYDGKSWIMEYIVIDTVSGKYDIIPRIECGTFPLSIIRASYK